MTMSPFHPYQPLDVPVPADVPEGFVPLQAGGPWSKALGPLWCRHDDAGRPVFAIRVLENHLNNQRIAHGGMLTTFADGTLGYALAMAVGRRGASVTASMTADFLSSARLGDWLESHVTITKRGRRLAYARCELRVGSRQVMHASGVFAMQEPESRASVSPPSA